MNASRSERGAIENFFAPTGGVSGNTSRDDNTEPQSQVSVKEGFLSNYFITLAPLSSDEEDDRESNCSSSVYDSIHNRETDLCFDTDDCSSDSSASSASREVIEFDVVTASSDDGEFLYIEDSSSGSDNYVIDQKIVVLQDGPRFSGKGDLNSSSSISSSSGNESGDSTDEDDDPELRPADYWKCVKCNNSQNNPLYRYCEKCYQLRKNYFPPRPKISKSRTRKTPRLHHHHHAEQSSTSVSSDDDEELGDRQTLQRIRQSPQRNQETANRPNRIAVDGDEVKLTNGASEGLDSVQAEDRGVGVKDGVRKRSISSQTTDEEVDEVVPTKKQKTSSSDEGLSSCSSTRDNQNLATNLQRPRNLNLANVLSVNTESSGCSSYSSGHESIPSPVEGDKGSCPAVVSSQDSEDSPMPLSMPMVETVSLSKDHQQQQGSYSDSETYRRSSTKCVVNMGEANAIIRRMQGDLGASKSVGIEGMLRGAEKASAELRREKTEEEERLDKLCIICVSEPKDSAFVHTRSLHICCCYRCAIKVWNKKKRCPICNCKVKNVLKCYVH